ncbi:hypothetical protein D3C72_1641640 [compost metagenome]
MAISVRPYSPSRIATAGKMRLRPLAIASTICAIATPGASQALPSFFSPRISPPPLRVRSTICSICSLERKCDSGTEPIWQ